MRRRRILIAALLTGLIGFFSLPVAEIDRPTSTVLLDRDGRLLGAPRVVRRSGGCAVRKLHTLRCGLR